MNLTDGEKLSILMLADIIEKLEISNGFDPAFLRSAINSDQTWGIPWRYPGIPFSRSQNETPEAVMYVLDVMDMWTVIERSIAKSSSIGKSGDSTSEDQNKLPISRFPGFDGNHEAEYLSIARFLIEDLDRYQEFRSRYLNAHRPTTDQYKRMLAIYNDVVAQSNDGVLDEEQLGHVLNASGHSTGR